jgi:hypothetical protein
MQLQILRRAVHRQQGGTAQHATSMRDAALNELDTGMRDLRIIARGTEGSPAAAGADWRGWLEAISFK